MEGFCKVRFPYCIESVDRTHFQISPLKSLAKEYINRKQTFSVLVQWTTDHTGRFIDIEIGYSRRNHDACVFKQSTLCIAMDCWLFCAIKPNNYNYGHPHLHHPLLLMQPTPYVNGS